TVDDTWVRVANAIAATEADPEKWQAEFYGALKDFKFLPAGRIMAGAGAGRKVTLFNCFVMGEISDSMEGIFDGLKEAALTMQQGGGIGYDFSTLRPKGALVKKIGADASGPLSFMDVWDSMCRTIMSAGSRRGAMMGVLRCDHPDIEAFIEAKQEPGRLRMFNLSVLITDPFMDAVKAGDSWDLVFEGTVYKSVPARELWDKIMRATYAYAEPGVIFIDRINRLNNLNYCETISATNPCVTSDTWVMTDCGPRQVSGLLGQSFNAVVDGNIFKSGKDGFFSTGTKDVLRLATKEGHALSLTENHLVRKVVSKTRDSLAVEWVPAGDLAQGEEIMLHDHLSLAGWQGARSEEEGYLLGLLIGDGTLKQDKAVLSVWLPRAVANGSNGNVGVHGVMNAAFAAARTLPHRVDFQGWVEVKGREELRMSTGALKALALEMGMAPGAKDITPKIEVTSSDFYCGFLRGFFDADGSVQGSQEKGVSIRLSQSDLKRLRAVQRMLLRLGINSTIYQNRRPAGKRALPDGRGGLQEYECEANHELVVSGSNLKLFYDRIGFADTDKMLRLKNLLSGYKRSLNRERFISTVEEVTKIGSEEVYDVQVPGANAFDANGLYVHNCGEQPLPPYGACLLGSINLARMVESPFDDNATINTDALAKLVGTSVRMMDNVIDVSKFPLPEQENEAKAKRRIGLGITGLGDALIMVGARYGSARAVELTNIWMATIERAAYLTSTELAAEKGAFPLYDADQYLNGEMIKRLDGDVREEIKKHGIRNALITSIAPTGTISIFADNVSSGLEPVFSFKYTRHVMQPDGSRKEEDVTDYAYRLYKKIKGENAKLTDAFVDVQHLSPSDHLVMQAAVQKYVDSSISKTINVPEEISFDNFKDIYMEAYDLGLKGCTTYRPNDVTGAVLEVKDAKAKKQPEQQVLPFDKPISTAPSKNENAPSNIHHLTEILERPGGLEGHTYKLRWPESEHAFYITINDIIDDNGRVRPFEIFINSKDVEHFAWIVALTRMISAVFRRGGDISFVVEELKAVFDPRGGHWMGGKYVPSLLAAMGGVIEQHLTAIGFLKGGEHFAPETEPEAKVVNMTPQAGGDDAEEPAHLGKTCPKCAQPSLTRQEGCDTCLSCGYSKCG
ncbi:MAG: ribonucleoside reductase, partial [Rhodospirillaceae bacterium]|nr:ribonucleoside reductase [Rhodospirillaceae bacterium]